jgi:hypothetical protein
LASFVYALQAVESQCFIFCVVSGVEISDYVQRAALAVDDRGDLAL